jgi:beta-lactam-binding protein with PASTA domain
MGVKLPVYLPRVAILVLVVLAATAGLTFAAGGEIASSTPAATPAVARKAATIVVPDLRNQAFVFAKGQLQDLGFAWAVHGGVHGYAANTVVGQSPAPGTKVLDTGAPLVTLTLARNGKYGQQGTPEDASPYSGTPLKLANAPKLPTATPAAPAKPKAAATTKTKIELKKRQPDFVVPGAQKEPLDELPLPARAAALGRWLADHPQKTTANVRHWLYQNAWIVAGARMGWWHGAEALRTLIAVDVRAQTLWGIGGKSEALARRALAEVEARKQ